MQARSSSSEQEGRTFTENSRRAQIVRAAIEVVAEQGYANASFAKIAKHAGLSSTGLISYHFKGKDDLIRAVVTEIMTVAMEFVTAELDGVTDYTARLRGYFAANLAVFEQYPGHMRALSSIIANAHPDDRETFGLAGHLADFARIQEGRMREAQRAGVFRDFDPAVMVMAMRGAIDAAVLRASADPDFDTAACARELADLFDHATRKQS
ncbi:TetR/AcrR family transcriptional regulator [Nocardia terpenica]|uniref:TetR family transcriptional regulator n=1 Tax=Nocardia terpenica TaxID=455432 RepID=A0A6G9Z9Z3_9NOCA|nr:TetR family transcriptional regulator [Nocardia terpenica]QIS22230.1 TetR family transcriptional regulator [Nocardia terpenica]